MELEGIVHDGVIVPDDANALPEGTRVRIAVPSNGKPKTVNVGSASALIAVMEAEPRLSTEDVAELRQAIFAGKRPEGIRGP